MAIRASSQEGKHFRLPFQLQADPPSRLCRELSPRAQGDSSTVHKSQQVAGHTLSRLSVTTRIVRNTDNNGAATHLLERRDPNIPVQT